MNRDFNSQGNPFGETTQMANVANASLEVRANFIRKTYVLFLAGVLTAVLAGAACLQIPSLYNMAIGVWRMPILAIGLVLGGSILAQALARSEGINYVALFAFTGMIGFLFAPIVNLYAHAVVGQAGFLTIMIFGGMTAYAFVSGKNFSFMGGFLFVGIWAVILAGIGNMFFFKSVGMSYWLAWGSLLISSGFVLYQTSNMIHEYGERDYCAAALGLFISFFNIFMSLLRILGGNRN